MLKFEDESWFSRMNLESWGWNLRMNLISKIFLVWVSSSKLFFRVLFCTRIISLPILFCWNSSFHIYYAFIQQFLTIWNMFYLAVLGRFVLFWIRFSVIHQADKLSPVISAKFLFHSLVSRLYSLWKICLTPISL